MQFMVICSESTMVVVVASNIRSQTLILNLMYDAKYVLAENAV